MFITEAFAQDAAAGGGADILMSLAPIVLMFVIFYLLLIRPQQKKMKEHRNMLANLRRGDKVVTSGGIVGTVTKVTDDDKVAVEIADGVRVQVIKGMITEVLSKTEPVAQAEKS